MLWHSFNNVQSDVKAIPHRVLSIKIWAAVAPASLLFGPLDWCWLPCNHLGLQVGQVFRMDLVLIYVVFVDNVCVCLCVYVWLNCSFMIGNQVGILLPIKICLLSLKITLFLETASFLYPPPHLPLGLLRWFIHVFLSLSLYTLPSSTLTVSPGCLQVCS
jgi:hypothetical protein